MKISHIALAILGMAAWGFNFTAMSLGLTELPPLLLNAVRFVVTAFPLIFFVRKPETSWTMIIAVGFILLTLQFTFLFEGIAMGVGGGIASTVVQSQVFFTLIISAILLGERPNLRDVSGIGIALIGIVLIALTMGASSISGLIMVVLAGLCWAIGNILLKHMGKVNVISLIAYASLLPPIPLFALSYFLEGPEAISVALNNVTLTTGFVLVYMVLVSTLFAYSIWGFLMKNYQAKQVAPFGMLVPVFGIFSGWLVMGEVFGPQRLLGAALVIAGLLAVNWRTFRPILKKILLIR